MDEETKKTIRQTHESCIRTETHVDGIHKTLKDHERRLRKAETFRHRVIGWAIGCGAFSAAAFDTVKSKLGLG